MDVKFKKQLIDISIKVAEESKHESVKDLFMLQARRLQFELDAYLEENPICSSAKAATRNRKPEKVKRSS